MEHIRQGMSIDLKIYSREMDRLFSDFKKEHDVLLEALYNDIESDLDVLSRKKKQLLYRDDYGNVVADAWVKELKSYVSSVWEVENQGLFSNKKMEFLSLAYKQTIQVSGLSKKDREDLASKFEMDANSLSVPLFDRPMYECVWLIVDAHEAAQVKDGSRDAQSETVTGTEYEIECERKLSSLGWNVVRRGGSGDQGVDLVGEINGERVVFQCKYYSSPVGNAAVQEVIAGMRYEGVGTGVVLTNSSFTIAAKQLANVADVVLLHHDDLEGFTQLILGQ